MLEYKKMKKKYIWLIAIVLILNNLVWLGFFAWEQLAWDIQFRSSVDYATELGFALGFDSCQKGKWTDESASSSRLTKIKTEKDSDCWDLPTNRGYILKLQKPSNGMIVNAFVNKK
jgi:hypothetical protein